MSRAAKVTISRADFFKAAAWIETNWEALKQTTRGKCAADLGAHIGRPINDDHVRSILRDMGREWPGLKEKRTSGRGPTGTRVRFVAREVVKLAMFMERLAAKLGEDIPPELRVRVDELRSVGRGGPSNGELFH